MKTKNDKTKYYKIKSNKIKYYRIKKGLDQELLITQTSLGDALGVTKTTVYLWESGRVMPKIEHQKALADYFKVNREDLFEYVPLTEEDMVCQTLET